MTTETHETGNTVYKILKEQNRKKCFIVCDGSFEFLPLKDELDFPDISTVKFSGFSSNPKYEDICKGTEFFRNEKCDSILAVGGGSAIDTAKCVRLFAGMNPNENYLKQIPAIPDSLFIAVPTTAGTGSEATGFAAIYFEGKKYSVADKSMKPDYALLDSRNLLSLPLYQKKCTAADALCQGIESWWSKNATEESRNYSKLAVETLTENLDGYLKNDSESLRRVLVASNLSGRAIDISKTTAAHAMSYRLTSLYDIPHGRAAFICLPYVWDFMIDFIRGKREFDELRGLFADIARSLGYDSPENASAALKEMSKILFAKNPVEMSFGDVNALTSCVNAERLKNNPVSLSSEEVRNIYLSIISDYSGYVSSDTILPYIL